MNYQHLLRQTYRYLKDLKSLGIAKFNTKHSGHFILNKSVISQRHIFQELLPSLKALKTLEDLVENMVEMSLISILQ